LKKKGLIMIMVLLIAVFIAGCAERSDGEIKKLPLSTETQRILQVLDYDQRVQPYAFELEPEFQFMRFELLEWGEEQRWETIQTLQAECSGQGIFYIILTDEELFMRVEGEIGELHESWSPEGANWLLSESEKPSITWSDGQVEDEKRIPLAFYGLAPGDESVGPELQPYLDIPRSALANFEQARLIAVSFYREQPVDWFLYQ